MSRESAIIRMIIECGRRGNMFSKRLKLSIALSLSIAALLTSSVHAEEIQKQRLYGNDRYDTSISIAQNFGTDEFSSVIVANGNDYADVLSTSPLENAGNSPILLLNKDVKSSTKVLDFIKTHLKKSGTIYILGGKASVSSEFDKYFKENGFISIVRFDGRDRYETNAKIAQSSIIKQGTPVIVVNGCNSPDALSISGTAAYKGYPVFITPENSLQKSVKDSINAIKPSAIYIIGGKGAVSDAVKNELGKISSNVVRIDGKDRYETSMNVCRYFDKDADTLIISNGENFADALSGTALVSKLKASMLVVSKNSAGSLKQYLSKKEYKKVIILGGFKSVPKDIENALGNAKEANDLKTEAQSFVTNLANKNIDAAVQELSDDLKNEGGIDNLKEYFKASQFKGVDLKPLGIKETPAAAGTCVTLTYRVTGYPQTFDANIKLDSDGKVYDASFENTPGKSSYKLPSYANMASFTEKDVLIGSGKYKLPGVLSIPSGKGPFPAVVLVHGSGASDKDESIYDNKIFRDISAGLASKGIAVLRYEKRTKEYGLLASADLKFDLNKETVNDAVDGVNLLKKTDGIDPNRVFVLGHSQGAMLTSSIIKDCGDNGAAGGIMMAAPVNYFDTLIDQYKYLDSIKMVSDDDVKSIEKICSTIESKDFPGSIPENASIYNAYPCYWTSVKNATYIDDAKSIKAPLLILQGKRDYQVNSSNLDKWKTILKDKNNVQYNSYDKLTHLFLEGEGQMTPTEYMKTQNVPDYVINDITNWIIKH